MAHHSTLKGIQAKEIKEVLSHRHQLKVSTLDTQLRSSVKLDLKLPSKVTLDGHNYFTLKG